MCVCVCVCVCVFKAKLNSTKVARQWPPFELYSFICNDLHWFRRWGPANPKLKSPLRWPTFELHIFIAVSIIFIDPDAKVPRKVLTVNSLRLSKVPSFEAWNRSEDGSVLCVLPFLFLFLFLFSLVIFVFFQRPSFRILFSQILCWVKCKCWERPMLYLIWLRLLMNVLCPAFDFWLVV